MLWRISDRADPFARDIADRHYNRQKVGAAQFVPPGRCVVLVAETPAGRALWVTSWPFAEFVKHEWAGAWVCSAFRNEGAGIAGLMMLEALAATRSVFGEPPAIPADGGGPVGLVTFIDRSEVRPTKVRGREVYGWTWLKRGFRVIGETKGELLALGIEGRDMPQAATPRGMQLSLFGDTLGAWPG